MDEMAALHYRVERTTSAEPASPGEVARNLGRRVARNWWKPTLGLGGAGSDALSVHDTITILDREGRVRFAQEITDRARGEELERRITDDLLQLGKTAFEARYALSLPD